MKLKLIFLLSAFLTTATAFAHDADNDEDDEITSADVVAERRYPASAKTRALNVLVHRAGHLADRPFVIEVNELCPANGVALDQPRVIDTLSTCDVAPETLAFRAETSELSLLVREPDAEGVCAPKPKRVVFQLESACGE